MLAVSCCLLTDCNARVRVSSLNQFFALVSHHPMGVDLKGSLGVQVHHLKLPEVRNTDGIVLWARVKEVRNVVIVKVIFTGITTAISCKIHSQIMN